MEKLAIVVFALVALFNCGLVDAETTPVVQTSLGKISGRTVHAGNNTVYLYESIRYGKADRYEKPKPVEPWKDTYHADTFRPICIQFGMMAKLMSPNANESEDCLFLSIWQPSQPKANRSVMFFIHGGAFEAGSSKLDGKDLAQQGDVIVVAINYRLGPFGWSYGSDIVGNMGLHDQILALKWVQQNIKYFGGDANSVTIFGESAGSISVGALTLSPLTKGLFKRAIMQSGSPAVDVLGNSKARGEEKTKILAKKMGCPNDNIKAAVNCIRACGLDLVKQVSMDDFVRNDFFVPIYGDEVLPKKPSELLKTGSFDHDIDLIYGVTKDEGTIFAFLLVNDIMTSDNITLKTVKGDMIKIMKRYNLSHQEEIADYYTARLNANSTQDDFRVVISSVFGDFSLACPTMFHGQSFGEHSKGNVYSYQLTQYSETFFPKWMGVTHGSDMVYLFAVDQTKNDPKLHELSTSMISAWSSFAKTGVPGKLGSVQWDQSINRQTKNYFTKFMQLEASNYKMVENFYKQTCDTFWKPKIFD